MDFDPDVLALFAAMREANLPTIDTLPPREARAMYRMQAERLGGPTIAMAETRELEAPGPAGPIPIRFYRPGGVSTAAAPALLYFHGGGWVIGDLDSHDTLCRQLAERSGWLVLAAHYRLAPEHPAPAAADDAIAALHWLADGALGLGVDPLRLAVGGDSAGGNLAAVAALAARERGLSLRAQILIYPAVDLRASDRYPSREANESIPPLTRSVMDYFTGKYLLDDRLAEDWRVSPVVAQDKSGLAPALVIVAERDVLHDEGLAYADALQGAGVPVKRIDVPGMIHGFITMFGAIAAATRVVDEIAFELRSLLALPDEA